MFHKHTYTIKVIDIKTDETVPYILEFNSENSDTAILKNQKDEVIAELDIKDLRNAVYAGIDALTALR